MGKTYIDIEWPEHTVQKYCMLPEQCDEWFKSYHKAVEMAGGINNQRRPIPKNETRYLDALVRGIYAKQDLKKGLVINHDNFEKYLFSNTFEIKDNYHAEKFFNGEVLKTNIAADEQLTIDNVDGPFSENKSLRSKILDRGLYDNCMMNILFIGGTGFFGKAFINYIKTNNISDINQITSYWKVCRIFS